jgi:transposase-like protein
MEDKPKDIAQLDFFTRQPMDEKGFAFMWVYKPKCPECNESRLKKLKRRGKIYTCESCKKNYETEEYNELLKYNLEYTCPYCEHKGELYESWPKPANRKSSVMLRFTCQGCNKRLKVARMGKKKKSKAKKK